MIIYIQLLAERFYSRYNHFNGDSSELFSQLEDYLEAIYPDSTCDMELNEHEESVYVDDQPKLALEIEQHIESFYDSLVIS